MVESGEYSATDTQRGVEILIEIAVTGIDANVKRAVKESLLPELASQPDRKRGEAYLEEKTGGLSIVIRSSSVSGARALFNAYIYLLMTAFKSIDSSRQS